MPGSFELWDVIVQAIRKHKFTPIIGNELIGSIVFGENNIVETWAQHENYPLNEQRILTRVAQFLSVTRKDAVRAKSRYLQFLNEQLLALAQQEASAPPGFLDQVRREARNLTISQLARQRLNRPDFKGQLGNPLSVLATLDIPVYLTTSPHCFIEAALSAFGKEPRTEVYPWRDDLQDSLPTALQPDRNFTPTVQTPLVFHLHGIDDDPGSLVLTEDDHLEFLINVTKDLNDTNVMPSSVRNAVSYSWLLLLGYHMHGWDLRVLLQGLIRGRPKRPRSFAVQLEPTANREVLDIVRFQEYLTNYFDSAQFDIYWGPAEQFLRELWSQMEAG